MEYLSLSVLSMFIVVALLVGRNLGWAKGYRQGKALNEPLVAAVRHAWNQEKELTSALQDRKTSLNEQIAAQENLIETLKSNIETQKEIEAALREQMHLMEQATVAREATIAAQAESITIYKSLN